ncbi:MAG: pyruvate:ferredoxin (flavodoxin) oxidoreductase, partial [Ruminiclostridium sp.]|nr:pyruvate:ferredoxin (flavodoxin) oxidoreductase [Ruminiclostridium sp.]
EELEHKLPGTLKRQIANGNVNFYTINATGIANEIGLGNRINMIMQAAFFKLADVIPVDEAVKYLKDSIVKSYGKKGEKIIQMNYKAVDQGIDALKKVNVPENWKNADDETKQDTRDLPDFIKNIMVPMNAMKGDDLPVSAFAGREDGTFPSGTSAYEKRGIAVNIPEWQTDNCIQCNQCSYVCPHAAIRPFLLNDAEKAAAPEAFVTKPAQGAQLKGLNYKIQVSALDCTGCGNCADICPSKNKALIMKPLESQLQQIDNWEYATKKVSVKDDLMPLTTIKGSQFSQPLIEFSGACAGCGEPPYIKVVTQLFGDRMVIANATGCSSIWGGSAPATVYTKNKDGKGPAWANSLFEDNAEYGYGMAVAIRHNRDSIEDNMKALLDLDIPTALKDAFNNWIAGREDAEASKKASADVLAAIEANSVSAEAKKLVDAILGKKDYLIKKSVWILGGDGWAYDIGYGGLDHVLASGENVNVLVFDTEVYSNTGGQSSKSTPTAAVAKFAASGKKVKKKDLGMIATTYGYVYVAQVAMGADKNQLLKAIIEAEKYDGPSLIIAYAPCINHGIREGMGRTQARTKQAVDSGYWHMWRFNPDLKKEGKNPFTLDSKEPTEDFQKFLDGEVRYTSLKKTFPDIADELFSKAQQDAKSRYEGYKKMAE